MVKYLFVILGTYPGLVVNIEAKPEWGPVGTPLVVASEWNQLGPGLNGPVYEITIDGNDVYVGGGFLDAGGNPDADYVARWDGCEWHALGPGLNGDVKAITVSGDNIYIGGSFTQPFNYIARWDGAQWNPMGPGPGNIVNSILKYDGNIIAGGGNWNTGFVSQWNETSWSTLGPSLNGVVNDMEINEGVLYAGGRFTNVGGNPDADGVIKWNGSAWQNLGLGIYADIFIGVFDLLAYNDELYVGGVFVSAGGNSNAHDVVKWDGEDWLHIGATLGGFLGLHALTIFNGSLYTTVGAGWASDDGIYRWDFGAETWDAFQIMELGADDPLFVLSTEGSNMYAGGYSGMVIEGESYAGLGRWGELSYPGIVTSAEDHGPGSLREIIACASNGDIITFMLPPLSQINLTSGEIIIDKDLTLSGPGVDELTISGNNQSRIFNLLAGKNFTVTGLSLKNAMAFLNGGAIYVKGNLNLEDVLLQNNFENTIPRGLTLISPGIFTSAGIVEIKY